MDIKSLWNFSNPEASEALFREHLATARGDDALSLQTQIARSLGLRSRFDEAHALLDAIEPQLAAAGPQPQVRHLLERGRVLRSAQQPERARPLFEQATDLAIANRLDELAVDAMHMLALVEPNAAGQMRWNQRALALANSSSEPNARSWDASLANNIGMTLHGEGRYAEALASFEAALAARERMGKPYDIRIARWMIAWTLRALKRHAEALAILHRLEHELDAIHETDGHVFEEIAENLLAQGDAAAAGPWFARAHAVLKDIG
jgi:tetratricopeptide (TPR) repeat protein